MMYQIWEADSANLVGSYDTEDAALAIVRKAIERHGRAAVESLVLLREGSGSDLTPVAEGADLANLALGRSSPAA